MIPIYLYLVGSSLVGFGFWIGRASGRSSERHDRDRVIDDVVRIRGAYAQLPAQQGTLAENRRRLELTTTPHVPEVEESWPLAWRVCWPVLLFVARFWWTPAGERVDRTVGWLYGFLGPRERRWWTDYNTGTHRIEDAAQECSVWEILAALDWETPEVGELVGT